MTALAVPDPLAAAIWRELALGYWQVLAAVDVEGERHVAIAPAPSKRAIDFSLLTKRECRVLVAVARGHSQKVIAATLGLSASTVSAAFCSARARLGFASPSELVRACQGAADTMTELV